MLSLLNIERVALDENQPGTGERHYISLTEKLSHLYMVVYVTLGDPLTGTLGLKNCKLLLSPTSSAFILSAALKK